jgi:hypothetical protein
MKHAIGLCALLVAAPASAADLPCGPAEKGTVQLDGLVDDWNDVEGLDANAKDSDASFTIKCNVEDGKTMLLLVDVRDNYMVRTRPGHPGEDHLSLSFNGHPLLVYPGNARDIPTVARWGSKPAKLKAVSALQERGWAVELAIPMATIPGFRVGMPIALDAQFADSDSKVHLKTERTVGVTGNIVFNDAGGGGGQLDAFLTDRKLGKGDIWFDQNARLVSSATATSSPSCRSRSAATSKTRACWISPATGGKRSSCATPRRAAATATRSSPSIA